jgi:hypothetical protein
MSSGYTRLPRQGQSSSKAEQLKIKKVFSIQLDTPSVPVINPGASHTYVIDLGNTYTYLAITDFQWVSPSLNPNAPDAVIGNAALPGDKFGGVLIVNDKQGGWERMYEILEPEFSDASPTNITAEYGATSTEAPVPLGYGDSTLKVPLDHTELQTTPPKKLQIQDAWLEGNNLKIVIKNVDTVAIDLSPYVGVTALVDENRPSQMAAVAENGTFVYSAFTQNAPNTIFIRLTSDKGKNFQTIDTGYPNPQINALCATSNSMNTFIGMIQYEYIKTAQSPNYQMTGKFALNRLTDQFMLSIGGPGVGGNPVGDKILDWKKTDNYSVGLFSGFISYGYDTVVHKTVDDFLNVGNNSPTFDNLQPILQSTVDLPDYENAAGGDSRGSVRDVHKLVKNQVKVVDENTYFFNTTYWSKPEILNNGQPKSPLAMGAQTVIGYEGVAYGLREDEIAISLENHDGNSAFGQFIITNSSAGNDQLIDSYKSNALIGSLPVYYMGAGTWGAEGVNTDDQQLIVLKSDWDALPETPLVGDVVSITDLNYWQPQIKQITDVQIDSVDFKVIRLMYSDVFGTYHGVVQPGIPTFSNGGSPIPDRFFSITKFFGRYLIANGRQYTIFRVNSILNTETEGTARVTFQGQMSTFKQKLLKTTDGGQTWTSVMEDPEFRYGLASVFHASGDGQTLLLASMRYWTGLAYEKWPYPWVPGDLNSTAVFNMSTDGGTTWKNSSGSWDKITGDIARLQVRSNSDAQIHRTDGQVGAYIDDTALFILYNESDTGTGHARPFLHRSFDNGTTWESKVELVPSDPAGQHFAVHGDSKDAFIAFAGSNYISGSYQYLFYGSLVDKFTQWPTYGVKPK